MASGGRPGQGSRLRARAESAVVSIPHPRRGDRLDLARLVPSARSIAVGLAILVSGCCAYLAARSTGVFAVRTIAVTGATPELSGTVRRALAPAVGRSLVGVDVGELERRVERLPTVAAARLDRAFPHRIVVAVVPERAVGVLRRGADSWLVSARGRVMTRLERGARPGLPRIWLARGRPIDVGETLAGAAASAVRAVAPLAASGLHPRVASAVATPAGLVLVLRSGLEVRLGDSMQIPLKLAVAASVLARLDDGSTYLDVAVPERPVAGTVDPQADIEAQTSTSP